jgi:hypothetical protein
MKAIRVHAVRGPEVLVLEETARRLGTQIKPSCGGAGVNFIDIYHRRFVPLPCLSLRKRAPGWWKPWGRR